LSMNDSILSIVLDLAVKEFSQIAKESEIWIVVGSFLEKGDDNVKIHNCTVVLNRKGEIEGTYRKRRPVSFEKISPGDKKFIFTTEFGKVAILICFDVENADVFDEVIADEPTLIINPVCIAETYAKNGFC